MIPYNTFPKSFKSPNYSSQRSFVTPYAKIVESTGLIERADDEGLLYFDNVYPVRHSLWDFRQQLFKLVSQFESKNILDYMRDNIVPKDLSVTLCEVIPRAKDGGAIIKFKNHSALSETEVENRLQEYAQEHTLRPWFNPLHTTRTYVIRGTPWIEDLHRFPAARIRVEFEGPDVDQEYLYSLFRRYGLIRDIIPLSPSSKDVPRFATIQYVGLRNAAAARNCLHGFVTPGGTKLHLYYETNLQKHIIREWIVAHPRIVIPVLAALIAAITVAIFDPIRTFFIKCKISKSFAISDNRIVKYAREKATSVFTTLMTTGGLGRFFHKEDAALQIGLADRKDVIDQLKLLISETPETFIVVQGPRGSGKVDLVREYVVKDRNKYDFPFYFLKLRSLTLGSTLTIDCQRLVETRSDALFVKEISNQIGYFPVFPWMNSVSSFVDLIAQGLIGQKAGFSETLESQFKKILENANSAVKDIAITVHQRSSAEAAAKSKANNGKSPNLVAEEESTNSGSEDLFVGSTSQRPVIVIEHFLYQADKHETMYNDLAEWAAGLVMAKYAHVIFVTDDVGCGKVLQKSLPNSVYNTISVGDAPPDVAKSFVKKHVMALPNDGTELQEKALEDIDSALEPLGGRMTDLLALVRRISIGETSLQAADEMIRQSSMEIIKRFLKAGRDKPWTSEQVWIIVKALANAEDIRYNQLLTDPLFKGGSEVISALEHAELITVTERDGRPNAIKAGRPIYRAAFQRLIKDRGLYADLEITRLTSLAGVLTSAITKSEEELVKLSALFTPKGPAVDVSDRMKFLADDIQERQKKITQCYKQIAEQKKVLDVEY